MKKIFVLLIIGSVILGCRKNENDTIEGPSLFDVYGEFSLLSDLESSTIDVDFENGETVFFTCDLSKIVNWKLEITGETSGATKIITGTSKNLNDQNALWDGSTTNFPMFRSETCQVMLTFENELDTLYTEVNVINPKTNEGFLISDFENGWNSGWTTFVQSGADMDFNIKSDLTAPEANSYYNMAGEVNWDWLIGLVDFNATAYDGANTFPLTDNADNLYFNALVYGDGSLPNSRILFRFNEEDNDEFGYEIPINWDGWKLISFKYNELTGNGLHNSNNITKVSILHLADPSSGYAKSGVDYLIFTENAPINP
ncbi:MAG: hypothetical protein ACPGU5_03535 [Lishizhenia sp.]